MRKGLDEIMAHVAYPAQITGRVVYQGQNHLCHQVFACVSVKALRTFAYFKHGLGPHITPYKTLYDHCITRYKTLYNRYIYIYIPYKSVHRSLLFQPFVLATLRLEKLLPKKC